jgi:hypothetical protein
MSFARIDDYVSFHVATNTRGWVGIIINAPDGMTMGDCWRFWIQRDPVSNVSKEMTEADSCSPHR